MMKKRKVKIVQCLYAHFIWTLILILSFFFISFLANQCHGYPPDVPNARHRYNIINPRKEEEEKRHRFMNRFGFKSSMSEGDEVEYVCRNGFYLVDESEATKTCHNGEWVPNTVPTCGMFPVLF